MMRKVMSRVSARHGTFSTDGSSSISEVADVVRPMGKMLQWQSVASSPSRLLGFRVGLVGGLTFQLVSSALENVYLENAE